MIEYAFARRLLYLRGNDEKIVFGFSRAYPSDDGMEKYPIEYYQIVEHDTTTEAYILPLWIRIVRIISLFVNKRKYLGRVAKHCGFYQSDRRAYIDVVTRKRDVICDGNFETIKYLDDIRPILLKEFCPKYEVDKEVKKIIDELKETESVFLSIRRWRPDLVNGVRVQLSLDYYASALMKINDLKHKIIFISSNDIQWCKENLNLDGMNVIWDSDKFRLFEKMEIIKQCKYHIMSNSTFSFMGMWLSERIEKTAIVPYIPQQGLYNVYVPKGMNKKNWILLDVVSGESIEYQFDNEQFLKENAR